MHQRRIISEDSHGNRTVEVEQTGAWRFLMFRGSFTVRMIVEQRRQDRTVGCCRRRRRRCVGLQGRRLGRGVLQARRAPQAGGQDM